MDLAQETPETAVLAQDEASMYLQATTTAVWAPRGQTPVVPVHPGREKVNFYGSLNLHTGQEVVMRAEVMNAAATAQHLQQILQAIPEVPILLLWDRGPWHFGPPIREVLGEALLRIRRTLGLDPAPSSQLLSGSSPQLDPLLAHDLPWVSNSGFSVA